MNFGTLWLTRMRIAPILLFTGCLLGKARSERDVLTNRQTEKLNFHTKYITSGNIYRVAQKKVQAFALL